MANFYTAGVILIQLAVESQHAVTRRLGDVQDTSVIGSSKYFTPLPIMTSWWSLEVKGLESSLEV